MICALLLRFHLCINIGILEFICPRLGMEQAKHWRFIEEKMVKYGFFFRFYLSTFLDTTGKNWDLWKNGQKWQFFKICDKIKGIKGEITTWYAKILKKVFNMVWKNWRSTKWVNFMEKSAKLTKIARNLLNKTNEMKKLFLKGYVPIFNKMQFLY